MRHCECGTRHDEPACPACGSTAASVQAGAMVLLRQEAVADERARCRAWVEHIDHMHHESASLNTGAALLLVIRGIDSGRWPPDAS